MTLPRGLLDEHAVGPAAFWIAVPISVFGVVTVLPEDQSLPATMALLILGSVLSTVLMAAALLIGATPVRRALGHPVLLPVTVLAVALFAGAARGVGVALSFVLTGQPDSHSWLARTVTSAVVFAVWFALIGGLVSSWTRYQSQRQAMLDELITRQLQLRLLDPQRPGVLSDETARKLDAMTSAVETILGNAHVSSGEDYARLSASLKSVIEERMRPLLHQIWQDVDPDTRTRPSTPPFLSRALMAVVPWGWAFGVYGLGVFFAGIVTVGIGLGIVAASIELVSFAGIVLAERWLFPRPRLVPRLVTLALAGVVPVALAWAVVGERVDAQVTAAAAFSLLITGPAVIFGSCAARAALDDGGPSVEELRRLLDDTEWDRKLLALETRSRETELASVLHNTVQARLYAAAIQLQTAALEGDDERAQLALEQARQAIGGTTQRSRTTTGTVLEKLEAVALAWDGIVDVSVECPSTLLMTSQAKLVVDAAEECVANAIRHAHARHVDVSVTQEDGAFVLSVTDDGDPVTSNDAPGLGTAWMEKVSGGQFARVRVDDATNAVTMRVRA